MGELSLGLPSGQLPDDIEDGGVPEDLVAAVAAAAVGQGFSPLLPALGEFPLIAGIAVLQPAQPAQPAQRDRLARSVRCATW